MRRPALLLALLLVTFFWPADGRAQWPSGTTFDEGLALDVTPQGFDALGQLVPTLVPSDIDLPTDPNGYNVYEYDYGTCCDPVFGWICWTCWEYQFAVWNGFATASIDDIGLTPRTGYLDLSATATIQMNHPSDPLWIYAYGEAGFNDVGISISIDQTCSAYTDPIEIQLAAQVYMDVLTGPDGRYLDVEIPELAWSTSLSGNDLHLGSCFLGDLIDFIQDVGGLVGFDPIGEIFNALEGQIDDAIQGFVPDLETTIEEAFAAARVEESVDLAGTTMDVVVEPYDVEILPAGMRLVMAGTFDAETHPCIAPYDPGGSLDTPGPLPNIGALPPGPPSPHHLGVMISDDFVNGGLYAAWRAGLLCYALTEDESLPINTALLTLLSRDAYADLFPETAPMVIETRPFRPPEAFPVGANDMNIEVRELGLDMYAELDYRQARVLGNMISADAGLDFDFDGGTGELVIDVAFDTENISNTVVYNEITPEYTEQVEEAFSGIFETILTPLLGDLIADITFPIPSMEGFGVSSLEYAAAGANSDFFGLFGNAGLVSYDNSDGCGDSGSCSGGCSTGTVPGALLALLPALMVIRRRVRRDASAANVGPRRP